MKKINPLLWVFKKMHRRIPGMLALVLSNVGSAGLGVVFALGTQRVIDAATSGGREAFFTACLWQATIIAGILFFTAFSRHMSDRLLADMDRDWKKIILHKLLGGDYSAVSRYHSGELINRLNNDVRIVGDGLIGALPNVVSMVVRLIGAMAALIALEPWFALLVCIAGVIVMCATGFMRRKLKALHKMVSEKNGIVSSFLQEVLEKLLMVQAMDVSQEMERRSDELLEERYYYQRKRKNVSLMSNICINMMSYGGGFVALVWCAFRLLDGAITFGALTAVTQLVSQLQAPFANLSSVLPRYIAMMASAERLMELEDIPEEAEPMTDDPQALYAKIRSIHGRNLLFAYDRDPVLDGVDFDIPKGSFVAITGPSGMGKSTLLKLMLGIFHQQEGQIYLDCGEETVPVTRATRKLFAYVPQGNLLLSGTIRENLLVAKPDATEAEIANAVYVSAMDEYLPQLPKGLDTPLGESGAGLSEGQAQRLVIARAILSNAPILLLDESTSALDMRTEHIVLERIRGLQNRTCIAVTHRSATLELCDMELKIRKKYDLMKEIQ